MLSVYCVRYVVYSIYNLVLRIFLQGWVIIDRSGKHFGSILNFIRDDFLPLPDNKAECMEVLAEAK